MGLKSSSKTTGKKRSKKKSVKKVKPQWLIIILVLVCELFVYTGARVECTYTGYRIAQLKAEGKQQASYRKALIIEQDRLGSPERIVEIAKTRLGLVNPMPDQMIYLDRTDMDD